MDFFPRPPLLSLIFFCAVCLLACDSGVSYRDLSQGLSSLQIGDSEFSADADSPLMDIPVDEVMKVSISRSLAVETITSENIFLVAVNITRLSTSFNASACDASKQIEAYLTYEQNQLVLTPVSELDCEAAYALCLSADIRYNEEVYYEGKTFYFQTESCAL